MPFTRRRRTRRRRRTTRRRPTALRAVRRLAKFVDTELNVVDTVLTNPDILDISSFTPLALVAQGVDSFQREGVQITLVHLRLKFIIQIGSQAVCVRFILFTDKQVNNNVDPLVLGDIVQNTGSVLEALTSPVNNDTRRRFRIHRDFHRTLVPGHSNTLCFSVMLRLRTKVRFTGPTADLLETISGMPFLMMLSNKSDAVTAPNVTMTCRATFAP